MNVLHVVPTFYPAVKFGGPIFSTLAICDGLSQIPDMVIEVLTTDSASPERVDRLVLAQNPKTFPNGFQVKYCKRNFGVSISLELIMRLPKAIKKSDIVHLTGPYSFPIIPTLLLCRLLNKPVVWSLRGGFQATEQWPEVPSRTVKILFEILCNIVRPKRTILHVTSTEESMFSRKRLPGINFEVIPNSVDMPDEITGKKWRKDGQLKIIFLSRLHEKKGLEDLIDAMVILPEFVTLDIFGEGDSKYVESLRRRAREAGCDNRIRFLGHVDDKRKTQAYHSADIFCLPTYSENFGIVIAEALAHGVPVVTTVNAPWADIERVGCGRWTDVGAESMAKAILSLIDQDLREMGMLGQLWMERDFSKGSMARRFETVYQSVYASE